MTKRIFPKNCGINFKADVTINDSHVIVSDFIFELNGNQYQVTGGDFEMAVGDTIYITPQGLQKVSEKEYPEQVFENGAAYWLVSKTKDDTLVLEVEA